MRNLLPVLTALLLTGCSGLPAATPGAPAGPYLQPGADPEAAAQRWAPVKSLSDEFNGGAIDTAKWQTEPVANGWRWPGRAPGLFRAQNVRVGGGSLNVTVGTLDPPVEHRGRTFRYQGGIVRSLQSAGPGSFIEARMKANATEMSSTFWLINRGRAGKKLELDIQECVGRTTELSYDWARNWDQIFHSNLIHRAGRFNPEKVQQQNSVPTPTPNHERYYVYAAWWKSPQEIRFYLDGVHTYSVTPSVAWDVPAHLTMAIETYDWNPVPDVGSMVEHGTQDQRTTRYDWVRVWQTESREQTSAAGAE